MSKKSKRKSEVKASILVLLLIAILLIASTYAWFTANKTVTISTLDVNVAAQNGLQISTDGTTWKSIITKEDITKGYTGHTNQLPTTMEPVSTIGEIGTDAKAGKMKMFYGTVLPNKTTGKSELTAVEESEAAGASGKFIAFDIFLKVDAPTDLNLSADSNVIVKEGTTDRGLQNAARVAFCVEGSEPAGTSVDTITALKGAVSFGEPNSTTYIWEPNSDVHTAAAVSNAKDTYGITTAQGPNEDAVEYYGVKQKIDTGIELINTNNGTDTTNFTKITPNYITKKVMQDTKVFKLEAGITKVRVYMWVEGQDVDCENSASGSDIAFNVQFTVANT